MELSTNQDSTQEKENTSEPELPQHVQQVQQQSVICQSISRPVRTITTTGHITTMDPQEIERQTVVEHSSDMPHEDAKSKEEPQEYDNISEAR